jgi:hypothetical protein
MDRIGKKYVKFVFKCRQLTRLIHLAVELRRSNLSSISGNNTLTFDKYAYANTALRA